MPGPDGAWGAALVAAVRAGEVPAEAVEEKVRRLLLLAVRVGALGGPSRPPRPGRSSTPASPGRPRRGASCWSATPDGCCRCARRPASPSAARTPSCRAPRAAAARPWCRARSSPRSPGCARRCPRRVVSYRLGAVVQDGHRRAAAGRLTDPETGSAGLRVRFRDTAGARAAGRGPVRQRPGAGWATRRPATWPTGDRHRLPAGGERPGRARLRRWSARPCSRRRHRGAGGRPSACPATTRPPRCSRRRPAPPRSSCTAGRELPAAAGAHAGRPARLHRHAGHHARLAARGRVGRRADRRGRRGGPRRPRWRSWWWAPTSAVESEGFDRDVAGAARPPGRPGAGGGRGQSAHRGGGQLRLAGDHAVARRGRRRCC